MRKLVAVAIPLHMTVHPIEPAGLVSHGLIVGGIHIVWHLAVGFKVPGRLAVEHLLLMAVRARRARRCLVIVDFIVMMMVVHLALL